LIVDVSGCKTRILHVSEFIEFSADTTTRLPNQGQRRKSIEFKYLKNGQGHLKIVPAALNM
jgi:hypothetical protein